MEICHKCQIFYLRDYKICIFCNSKFTTIFSNECEDCECNFVCDNCDILSWKTKLIYVQSFDQNLKHHKKLERERNRKNG